MVELKPRDTQTQVKHYILEKYLETWESIIINGLRYEAKIRKAQGKRFDLHLVYVDSFSGWGRYSGDHSEILLGHQEGVIYGSPVIGVRAIDRLKQFGAAANIGVRVNAILTEIDQTNFQALLDSLRMAGLENRVKDVKRLTDLKDGEIFVQNVDYHQILPDLLRYTGGQTFSFYFLDACGPKGIPHNVVAEVIKQPRADVMINFPYLDIHRKAPMALKSDLSPRFQGRVEVYTEMYGDVRWKEIMIRVENERNFQEAFGEYGIEGEDFLTDEQISSAMETELVGEYRKVLQETDQKLAVKLVDLKFPEKERTMFYLFLTTHDGTGALALNEILFNAKLWEYELRERYKALKRSMPSPYQKPLFTVEPKVREPEIPARPTVEDIAQELMRKLKSESVSRREVYRICADDIYFPGEIDKTLNHLKKSNKVQFTGKLRHDTLIMFGSS